MLRYLVEDYWGRRAGWPDLLVYRDNEFFFAEVKSADDKLGKSQERSVMRRRFFHRHYRAHRVHVAFRRGILVTVAGKRVARTGSAVI